MDNKKEFSEWLNQQFNTYDMTEAKLARLVGVSQKSINRYRNALTCPDESVQAKIKKYFLELEANKLSVESSSYEIIDDETDESYYYYDEPDEDPGACGIYMGKELLNYYTVNAQKFILANSYTFYFMEEYEFDFIDKVRLLSEKARKQLVEKMESMPICLEMLLVGEWDYDFYDDTLSQMQRYAKIIQWPEPYPENWHTKIDPETNIRKIQYRKNHESKYIDFCETLYYQGHYMHAPQFFQKVDRCMDYTINDWYMLFLLARTRRADEADRRSFMIYHEEKGHGLREREYMIWKYLEVLACKK